MAPGSTWRTSTATCCSSRTSAKRSVARPSRSSDERMPQGRHRRSLRSTWPPNRPCARSARRRAVGQAAEGQLLAATAGARAHDRLADLRRAIAVLERRAVRCDVAVLGDRAQEVMHLVHERISPSDDVPGRPPEIHERMVRLGYEHGPEAARAFLAVEKDLQLVHAFHVEVERPARAVDLPLKRISPSERETRRLDRPDRAALELDGRLDRVVDPATAHERLHDAGDRTELADEVARQVDHVRAEISERAGSRLVRIEAPGVERRIVAPVLQVTATEVADLPEAALVDQLACKPHRGDEAVVEPAEMLDSGRGDAAPHVVTLVGGPPERLLAEDVFAGFGGGDRRLGMERVRTAVVEQADSLVRDHVVPVGRPTLIAESER